MESVLEDIWGYAIISLDVSGDILTWNAGAERTKGYKKHEVIGKNFSIFYTTDDIVKEVPKTTLDSAFRYSVFETEGWRVRKDGTQFWASVVVHSRLDATGKLIGFVKVTRDATERRTIERLREELNQAQKMEAVGQLVGGLAHDFNNLMTSIEGGMSLIEREDISALTKRVIEVNRVAMDRARKVISQLLAFSRRQVLRPKATNIGETLKVFEPLLRRAVGEAITLEWDLDANTQVAFVDPGQLQSAMLNLVINARDALPQGGTLRIFTESLLVPVDKEGGRRKLLPGKYVVVGVQDNGTGMSPEVLRRASEPFFTTKELDKGSGLGLSQCDGFASQSGGELQIESSLGQGTVVRMILPRHIAGGVNVQPDRLKTILVVEDDEPVKQMTLLMLTSLGHRVIEASDATEALRIIQTGAPIDVLFTDIVMPNGQNGVELVKQVLLSHPEVTSVLTSGYAKDALSQITELPEDVAFMAKPYDMHDLERCFGDGE